MRPCYNFGWWHGQMAKPGFFMGLVHGVIAPIAMVAEIFSDVRIYAFPNSGWPYDLGFLIGVLSAR